jgi:chromosomal replication initiation ATPase DnaA
MVKQQRIFISDTDVMPLILEAIKEVTGVGAAKLKEKSRKGEIAELRQIAMTIADETKLVTRKFIALYFRKTDESIVMRAAKRVYDLCDTEYRFNNKVNKIRSLAMEKINNRSTVEKNLEVYNEVKSFL